MNEPAQEQEQADREKRPALERADELVDRLGKRTGTLASLAGLRIRKLAARAREEAEDVWAEAHSVRRRKQS